MPRQKRTPNWKTAPALHELMNQVEALYEEAWNGEETPGQEITVLIEHAMAAFVALGVTPQQLDSAILRAGLAMGVPKPIQHPQQEAARVAQEPVVAEKRTGLGGIFKG
jgi:hypothetical protein